MTGDDNEEEVSSVRTCALAFVVGLSLWTAVGWAQPATPPRQDQPSSPGAPRAPMMDRGSMMGMPMGMPMMGDMNQMMQACLQMMSQMMAAPAPTPPAPQPGPGTR